MSNKDTSKDVGKVKDMFAGKPTPIRGSATIQPPISSKKQGTNDYPVPQRCFGFYGEIPVYIQPDGRRAEIERLKATRAPIAHPSTEHTANEIRIYEFSPLIYLAHIKKACLAGFTGPSSQDDAICWTNDLGRPLGQALNIPIVEPKGNRYQNIIASKWQSAHVSQPGDYILAIVINTKQMRLSTEQIALIVEAMTLNSREDNLERAVSKLRENLVDRIATFNKPLALMGKIERLFAHLATRKTLKSFTKKSAPDSENE